jgi:hypothetical protein
VFGREKRNAKPNSQGSPFLEVFFSFCALCGWRCWELCASFHGILSPPLYRRIMYVLLSENLASLLHARERERESCRERFLSVIFFIWLFSGCWILISSSAKLTTYTLTLNFVTCFFRVKQMRSGGVIIRTTRQSGSIQQERNGSLNIG